MRNGWVGNPITAAESLVSAGYVLGMADFSRNRSTGDSCRQRFSRIIGILNSAVSCPVWRWWNFVWWINLSLEIFIDFLWIILPPQCYTVLRHSWLVVCSKERILSQSAANWPLQVLHELQHLNSSVTRKEQGSRQYVYFKHIEFSPPPFFWEMIQLDDRNMLQLALKPPTSPGQSQPPC